MKKLILASVSALPLLAIAACSDSTDSTTTQSTTPSPEATQPSERAMPPATDGTTTQGIDPRPESGTGGDVQNNSLSDVPEQAPVEPAPAQ